MISARVLLPAAYVALALFAWIDFVRTNPDGLANLGLMAVALPVTLFGLGLSWLVGSESFVLLPTRFGYYLDHALFYWPSVALTAALLYGAVALATRTRPRR